MRYQTLNTSVTGAEFIQPIVVANGVLVAYKGSARSGRSAFSRTLGKFSSVAAYQAAVEDVDPLTPTAGWTVEACHVFNRAVRVTRLHAEANSQVDVPEVDEVRPTKWRNTTITQRAAAVDVVLRSGMSVHAWCKVNPDGPGRSTLYRWVNEMTDRRQELLVT